MERFSVQGVGFVLGLLIARILSPEDYGLIAVLHIFFAVFSTFIDSGFSSALIRKTDRSESDNSTVFYYNVAVGFATFLIFFFLAGPLAAFFDAPVLKPIIRVLSLTLVINSLGAVQQALLSARIDFKSQAKVSVIAVAISGLLGLFFAYRGYGVWALVIQMLSSSVLRTFLLAMVVGWRPTMPFSRKSFDELFAFGSRLLASSLLNTIYDNIYTLLIGKFYHASSVGVYSRADHFAQFPSSNFTGIIQRVTYPVLSVIQNEDERLKVSYRKLLRLSAFVVFPMMVGLAVLARPMVLLLLTDKWIGVVELLQILCLALLWYPIHAINLNLLQVKGRSDLFLRVEVIKKCIGIIILLATLPAGIVAMCWGRVGASVISLSINMYYTGKLIDVGFAKQIKDILPILLLSVVMGGAVWLISGLFDSDLTALLAGTFAGIVIYMGIAFLFRSKELKYLTETIKQISL